MPGSRSTSGVSCARRPLVIRGRATPGSTRSRGTTRPQGRTTSRTSRKCCRRSTGAASLTEPSFRGSPTSAAMDRRRAGAGFTRASICHPVARWLIERESRDYLGHGWGFAWPADRRILYNRASARPDGSPWSERKKLVWWDAAGRAVGRSLMSRHDIATQTPNYHPPEGARGDEALSGTTPFLMHQDGLGWLWVPIGLRDGPMPADDEPLESPLQNALYPRRATNPPADRMERPDNRGYVPVGDGRFPHVLTTYRLTEHHTAGGMSRYVSRLAELQPEFFAEISPELAREIGATHGGWVTVASPRGVVEARALVTTRMPSLAGRRPADSPGRPAVSLGHTRAGDRRFGQRFDRDVRRAERPDHGNQGTGVPHQARAAAAGPRRPRLSRVTHAR